MGSEWIRVVFALALFVAVVYGLCLAMDLDDTELLADLAEMDLYDGDRRGA